MRRIPLAFVGAVAIVAARIALAQEPAPPAWDPKAAVAESDHDGDGRIDPDEFYERITEVYYHADVDRDGTLSEPEYGKAVAVSESFSLADANGDGKVTLREFYRERSEKFEQTDANDDGVLTESEVVDAYRGGSPAK